MRNLQVDEDDFPTSTVFSSSDSSGVISEGEFETREQKRDIKPSSTSAPSKFCISMGCKCDLDFESDEAATHSVTYATTTSWETEDKSSSQRGGYSGKDTFSENADLNESNSDLSDSFSASTAKRKKIPISNAERRDVDTGQGEGDLDTSRYSNSNNSLSKNADKDLNTSVSSTKNSENNDLAADCQVELVLDSSKNFSFDKRVSESHHNTRKAKPIEDSPKRSNNLNTEKATKEVKEQFEVLLASSPLVKRLRPKRHFQNMKRVTKRVHDNGITVTQKQNTSDCSERATQLGRRDPGDDYPKKEIPYDREADFFSRQPSLTRWNKPVEIIAIKQQISTMGMCYGLAFEKDDDSLSLYEI